MQSSFETDYLSQISKSPEKEIWYYYIPVNTLNKSLLSAIAKSNKSISFSTFSIDKNTELVRAIVDKARNNVSVVLFCRPVEKLYNEQLKDLLEYGIEIYFHQFVHAKSLLVDDENGFIFTANFTKNGLNLGLEVGVELNEQQIKDLSHIHHCWKADFPSKANKVEKIRDLKELEYFKDGILAKRVFIDENKSEKLKINRVTDLMTFFNKKFEIRDLSVKSLKVKQTAEFEEMPGYVISNESGKFDVTEVVLGNGKKSKVVVVGNNFTIDDINDLLDYKDLSIFSSGI